MKRELYDNKIKSETLREGVRAILRTDIPTHIKNTSYKIALGSMKTKGLIVKFKSNPIG